MSHEPFIYWEQDHLRIQATFSSPAQMQNIRTDLFPVFLFRLMTYTLIDYIIWLI